MTKILFVVLLLALTILNANAYTYEDEVGEIDWYKENVGSFVTVAPQSCVGKILVSTRNNLLASIQTKTGKINWRRSLSFIEGENSAFLLFPSPKVAVTISSNRSFLHVWESEGGSLFWEQKLDGNKKFVDVAFNSDSTQIIILLSNSVQIRESKTGKLVWKTPKM